MATDPELEDIIINIVQSYTTEQLGKRKTNLGKRRLFSLFKKELTSRELYPVGAHKFDKLLHNLWKSDRVNIFVDGIKVKDLADKSLQGKKWDIAASTLSNELKHKIFAVAIDLDSLRNQINMLKKTEKFSPTHFANYILIKQRIFTNPFSFYLDTTIESEYIRLEMLNYATKYITEIGPIFKEIERNQEMHYPNFGDIIRCLEKIVENNGRILALRSLDSKSQLIKIQCGEIEHTLSNLKNELKSYLPSKMNKW